ncbi:hypothetical protein GCM10023165_35820 [Variovorax defluvii]|uniref:Uncharacterized protein n=1 Tax=Variovorax defluvii TaxID=913761 RepID=A0ABP8I171_9BURK
MAAEAPQRNIADIAEQQFSIRTAASTDAASNRSSLAPQRSKLGRWQNRSASAGVCVRRVTIR